MEKPEHIANTIMKQWEAVHRSVDQFLTCNVGDFLCEAINIRLQTIWAKSPCCKGIVERELSTVRNVQQSFIRQSLLTWYCTCMVFKCEKFIANCSKFFTLSTCDWAKSITYLCFQWQTPSNFQYKLQQNFKATLILGIKLNFIQRQVKLERIDLVNIKIPKR